MAKTSATTHARDRARQLKAAVDADRVARDRVIEDQQVAYLTAAAAREQAAAGLAAADRDAGAAAVALIELGEPSSRIAGLLGVTEPEVRRLRRLAGGGGKETLDAQREK